MPGVSGSLAFSVHRVERADRLAGFICAEGKEESVISGRTLG